MHEYAVVRSLLDRVDQTVLAHSGRRARRVVVAVAAGGSIDEASLRGAFDTFKAETTARDAELVLESSCCQLWCLDCEAQDAIPDGKAGSCPRCGSHRTLPLPNLEIYLKSIEIEV